MNKNSSKLIVQLHELLTALKAMLKNVASGRLAVAADAHKAQCMWKYMRISSTAGHHQAVAQ